MLPRNHPDRIQITFDDRRLVANAGSFDGHNRHGKLRYAWAVDLGPFKLGRIARH